MNLSRVPQELRDLNHWVLWRGKQKIPYQPQNPTATASAGVPESWSTFDSAVAVLGNGGGFDGIGFEFHTTDEFCGVDLDGCRDPKTGLVEPWAKEWILKFNSYSEVSPSKTGVKIFLRGKHTFGDDCTGRKKNLIDVPQLPDIDKKPGVEIYDHGRYFAVTGIKLAGVSGTCEYRQDVINEYCKTYWPAPQSSIAAKAETSVAERAEKYIAKMPPAISGSGGHNAAFKVACVLVLGFGLTDQEALSVMAAWNQTCTPPWSDRELIHKIQSAAKQPGPRNYLRDAKPEELHRIVLPNYTSKEAAPKSGLVTTEQAARVYLDQLRAGKESLVKLGLADLDDAIGGGVAPGELVIIAARPSHGKSAVALQLLDQSARDERKGLLISEEMSIAALGKRTVQFAVDMAEYRWKHEIEAVDSELEHHFANRTNVFIAEACLTADVAVATIRQAVMEHGIQVAVVDYAQLLKSSGNSQFDHVTNTSIAMRRCATELKIVVVMLCQLSRDIESRDKFVPRMSDLRNSGQLEQDADVIIFLVWPHKLNPEKPREEFMFFVAKNRNREIREHTVKCRFIPERQMVLHELPEEDPIEERTNYSPTLANWSKGSEPSRADDF